MKIALVTDTHFQTNDRLTIDNWRAVLGWLAEERPDLMIHLGDISANGGHDGAELAHARGVLASAGVEMLCLPGNHDIGDHAPAGGFHPREPFDLDRLADYRRLFGPDWWSRRTGGWLLLGLNAPLLSTGLAEEEAQYDWLASEVAGHSGPVGLFLHKPLCRDALEEDIVHTRYVPLAARRRLMAALAGLDLRFVAAGHTHQSRRTWIDGVEQVWVPSSSFVFPDAMQETVGEKRVGTMMLKLAADGHRFQDCTPEGTAARLLTEFVHVYPELADRIAATT